MIDPKFCPACGSKVVYTANDLTRCHTCGLDFQVLDDEEKQDYEQTVETHKECPSEGYVEALEDLKEVVETLLNTHPDDWQTLREPLTSAFKEVS